MKCEPKTEEDSVQDREPGRLVIQFLQEQKSGATMPQILRYLRSTNSNEPEDMVSKVENLLESGTSLGFLERRGSNYVNWAARGVGCGRRKRRRRSCRRKRKRSCSRRRKRSCGRRRRRKRTCCCKKR